VNADRVYFVATGDLQRVKIGKTRNLEQRVYELQNQNAHHLMLIADVAGYTYVEKHFHELFAAERLHGEWFKMSAQIIETVCNIRREGPHYSAQVATLALAADGIEWTGDNLQSLRGRKRYLAQTVLYKNKRNALAVQRACAIKIAGGVD